MKSTATSIQLIVRTKEHTDHYSLKSLLEKGNFKVIEYVENYLDNTGNCILIIEEK